MTRMSFTPLVSLSSIWCGSPDLCSFCGIIKQSQTWIPHKYILSCVSLHEADCWSNKMKSNGVLSRLSSRCGWKWSNEWQSSEGYSPHAVGGQHLERERHVADSSDLFLICWTLATDHVACGLFSAEACGETCFVFQLDLEEKTGKLMTLPGTLSFMWYSTQDPEQISIGIPSTLAPLTFFHHRR